MKLTNCLRCGIEVPYRTAKPKYCPVCRKKVNSELVMQGRKRRNPNVEIGVGSGNYSTNKDKVTTGISIYRRLITSDSCTRCGSRKNLLVHHKDEDRTNNQVTNLEVLCKACHQSHHLIRDPKTGRYLGKVKRGERVSAVCPMDANGEA